MVWNIVDIIIGAIAAVGGVFGIITFFRKPKARLQFTNGEKEISFSPLYYRANATKYYVDPPTDCYDSSAYRDLLDKYNQIHEKDYKFRLPFRLTNTGKVLLENYRVEINIAGGGFSIDGPSITKGVTINRSKPMIVYDPSSDFPYLNQKDSDGFSISITPDPDIEKYEIHWRIIAKNCSESGKLYIKFTPTIEKYDDIHFANCTRDLPENAEVIKDLKPYIRDLVEKFKKEGIQI